MKQGLFHTLCTCGADNSKIARGYPIGLRRFFSGEHCLRLTLRSLTACRVIWRNSISDKDLRAWGANTAERIRFCRRSEPGFRSVSQERSRPTKLPGPSLDSAVPPAPDGQRGEPAAAYSRRDRRGAHPQRRYSVFGICEREPRLPCRALPPKEWPKRKRRCAAASIVVTTGATSLPNCLTCLTSPRRASGSPSRPPAGGASRAEREP